MWPRVIQRARLVACAGAILCVVGGASGQVVPGPLIGFGNNGFGQLNVPPGKFVAVVETSITCAALRADGSIALWGDPDPVLMNAPPGPFKFITAGASCYFAIRMDDTLVGWGYNFMGELNAPPGTYRKVAAGWGFSAGILTDGSLAFWGSGLGGGTIPGNDFVDIAVGEDFALALRANGSIVAVGFNAFGQLNVPPGTYTAVVAGQRFGAAIRTDGTVAAWGDANGLLGPLATQVVTQLDAAFASLVGRTQSGEMTGSSNIQPTLPGFFSSVGATFATSWFGIVACYPNCDGSTTSPILTANDFQCFLNRFASGLPSANCDQSSASPALNANDFQCFLNSFATGCD